MSHPSLTTPLPPDYAQATTVQPHQNQVAPLTSQLAGLQLAPPSVSHAPPQLQNGGLNYRQANGQARDMPPPSHSTDFLSQRYLPDDLPPRLRRPEDSSDSPEDNSDDLENGLPPEFCPIPNRPQDPAAPAPEFHLRLMSPAVQGNTQYTCGAVLESRFLLLGHTDGLHVLDLAATRGAQTTAAAMPKRLIASLRFRKIRVVEGCRVIIALAGRNRYVRCYSLDAMLRQVYQVFGLDWAQRRDKAYGVPDHKDIKNAESASGDPPKQPTGNIPRVTRGATEGIFGGGGGGGNSGTPSPPSSSAGSMEDYYFKLPDSRDANEFDVYPTSAFLYMAVLAGDKITVWQRPKEAGVRAFTRIKVFWIPTDPVYISLADDRTSLRHIVAVFPADATVINLRDSKVKTITLDQQIHLMHREAWAQLQNTPQTVPYSGLDTSFATTSSATYPPAFASPMPPISSSPSPNYTHYFNSSAYSSSLPRSSIALSQSSTAFTPQLSNAASTASVSPMAASPNMTSTPFIRPLQLSARKETGPPPIIWTSLIQLPFSPDLLPPESLTQDFTVPPAYSTVIAEPAGGNQLHAPVPLTSSSPQLFLATLATRSYIIDITGALYSTSTLQWSMVPCHIEFIRTPPKSSSPSSSSASGAGTVYVVGFGKLGVEVLDLRTGRCVQKAVKGLPIEYLGRWDDVPVGTGASAPRKFQALFWCCFVKSVAYLYMLTRAGDGVEVEVVQSAGAVAVAGQR